MLEVEKKMAEFENQISLAEDIKEKLKHFRFYALFMSQIDPKKSYEIVEEGVRLSLKIEDEFEQQWMAFLKGICLVELDKNDLALSVLLGVKNYFFLNNEKEFYYKTLSNIAVVYFNLQRYNQAIFIWKDLLINYIQHDDYEFKNLVMNNLIAAYQNTFFFNDFSEIQIKEILDYYHLNNIKKDQTYCDALVNLATHYRLKYNYKKAIEIGLESLHLANLENYNKLSVKKREDTFIIVAESKGNNKKQIWTYEDLTESQKQKIKLSPKEAAVDFLNTFANNLNINQKEGEKKKFCRPQFFFAVFQVSFLLVATNYLFFFSFECA
jgi:tetratricopeptide (TPR) repeat protein